jgi:hypothetical protein
MSDIEFSGVRYDEVSRGDLSKLYSALALACSEFPDIPKNKMGQKGNQKFPYAPIHIIRKCILPVLAKHGIGYIQPLHTIGKMAALTLIVSGHGASISSTYLFEDDSNRQEFGNVSTYSRRYQLQAFFGLEGDKDADDPDDAVEVPAKVVKTNGSASKPANKPAVQVDNTASKQGKPDVVEPDDTKVSKPATETVVEKSVDSKANETKPESPVRSPNDNLMNAKSQLGWSFDQFGEYCKKNAEHFPDFVDITKMKNPEKVKLHQMLVKEFSLAPF